MIKYPKKFFYFLGSVRLAVPSMLILALVIGLGTIIESRYNAEYAQLMIFHNVYFNGLMILIWINILFATLTRWPWKKHHTGFLITHLGLLLLFGGSFITNVWGIDGSLRVEEDRSSNQIILSDLVLGIQSEKDHDPIFFNIPRNLKEKNKEEFSAINEKLQGLISIEQQLPFVEIQEISKPIQAQASSNSSKMTHEPLEVKLQLKSNFFDVESTLNSKSQNEVELGPAQIKLVKDEVETKSTHEKIQHKKNNLTSSLEAFIQGGTKKKFKVNISSLPQSIQFESYTITLKKFFKKAIVSMEGTDRKIKNDDESTSLNPALEITISSQNQKPIRDILFSKYPDFSLRTTQLEKLKLNFSFAEEDSSSLERSFQTENTSSGKNLILVKYNDQLPSQVKIELWKKGAFVSSKTLSTQDIFQTPWMGMTLTLKEMIWGAEKSLEVKPIAPKEKMNQLPPSALKISLSEAPPDKDFWMTEGSQQLVQIQDRNYMLYYGNKVIDLPFSIHLKKFLKTDYPGTSQAKEFESHIEILDQAMMSQNQALRIPSNETIRISMNQPLYQSGFTIYQSSFEQLDGGRFASIFSVNKDPGRFIKYIGGIILALGIIIYSLSKSRFFLKPQTQRSKL